METLSRQSLARAVTESFSPLRVDAVLLIAIALHSASSVAQAVEWAFIAVLFVSAIPALIILRGVQRQRLTDHHVSIREQRPLPIALALISIIAGFLVLIAVHASRELLALLAAMVVGLVVTLLITLRWKISLHTGTLAGAMVILALVFGSPLLLLFPLVVVVSWARVQVGDHTLGQVIAGIVLGTAVAGTIFSLLR